MNFSQALPKKGRKTVSSGSSPSKLALGLSLIILGSFLFLANGQRDVKLSSSFENEPVKIQGLSENEIDESKIPKKIVIPDLSIDLNVKKANIVNGFWEVFEDSAAWGKGSGIPGEIGNQVIFAHARKGLFLPLQSIKVGTDIYILTDSGWFQYEVNDIKEVYPSQTEVIEVTADETLTLYTCSGYADSKRLIVIAKRTKLS